MKKVVPYKSEKASKKEQVQQMFDNIAPKYDVLNHILTFGIDKGWRTRVCKIVSEIAPKQIMDMAAGTGELAIQLSNLIPRPNQIVGVDISEKMLKLGHEKVQKKKLEDLISFKIGDAEAIEEENHTFDAVTCAFGVRNFENIEQGLSEFYRVLDKNGRLVILELSMPSNFLFRMIYNAYFCHILPFWGRLVSKDKEAYRYLPESVAKFPKAPVFIEKLKKTGFKQVYAKPLTFGIATIFVADK